MTIKTRHLVVFVTAVFVAGFAAGTLWQTDTAVHAQGDKVFELRTYTAPEGKLPNLEARFRDHTTRIFEKHGMSNVGYWVPQDAPASDNTLIYISSRTTAASRRPRTGTASAPTPSGRRCPARRRSTAAS